jgi:hypothetical protein
MAIIQKKNRTIIVVTIFNTARSSGNERRESGPLGRKGGAPNWEEAGAATKSTATNEDRGFTHLQLSL